MKYCKLCFKDIKDDDLLSFINPHLSLCNSCYEKLRPRFYYFKVEKYNGLAIYDYDEDIRALLYQFKGCFDVELGGIFLDYFRPFLFLKYFGYTMVPAPSAEEADKERGFNHVIEMFSYLKLKMLPIIRKTTNVKQSDLKASERANIKKSLTIDEVDWSKKRILIVDDVYTTGSTVKAMIDLVKSRGAKKIKVLVMSKTRDIQTGV